MYIYASNYHESPCFHFTPLKFMHFFMHLGRFWTEKKFLPFFIRLNLDALQIIDPFLNWKIPYENSYRGAVAYERAFAYPSDAMHDTHQNPANRWNTNVLGGYTTLPKNTIMGTVVYIMHTYAP